MANADLTQAAQINTDFQISDQNWRGRMPHVWPMAPGSWCYEMIIAQLVRHFCEEHKHDFPSLGGGVHGVS